MTTGAILMYFDRYLIVLVIFTALSCIMVEIYHTNLPIYGVALALVIPAIYFIPCALIQGAT
jgi:hypothetical protein